MEEITYTYSECTDEKRKMWEQRRKECNITKSLDTYDDCKKDMYKWRAFDREHHSYHYCLIFDMFREDYTKYPLEYQMKLLIYMYTFGVSANLRNINAVIRKIYKAETKEIKSDRTQKIREELTEMSLINIDVNGKEYVNVYRGVNHESALSNIAISWTYNRNVAEYFANKCAVSHRDDRCCKVLQGKIYVKDILSIEHDRSEDEIIAFPHKVFDILEVEGFVANYEHNG